MRLRFMMTILALGFLFGTAWAQEADESRSIDILRSGAAPAQKDAACKRLKAIGTSRAVPALAECLANDALAHAAREALQAIPGPEAGDALLAALAQASGMSRLGIVDSLGIRREGKAVRALTRLLADADAVTASAAARSLGRIGTRAVVRPLEKALPHGPASVRSAVADGLLRTAEQMRAEGHEGKSIAIARKVYRAKPPVPGKDRVAAYRAWVRAEKHNKVKLLTAGLKGSDEAARQAVLSLATEFPGEDVTRALADAVKKAAPKIQAALLAALGQRGDTVACPAIVEALGASESAVRVAALNALCDAGDASAVSILAATAAGGDAAERKAAQQALGMLHHGDVHAAILDRLPGAASKVQIELIGALAARLDTDAIPALCALAERNDEPVRLAAVGALGALADASCIGRLLTLLRNAESEELRTAAEDAVVAVGLAGNNREAVVAALLGIDAASPAAVRVAALNAAARIDAARALAMLRVAVHEADRKVRQGAVRTLARFGSVEAMGDLLALAGDTGDGPEAAMALRGYWRLAGASTNRPVSERLEAIRAGYAKARTPEDKKAGLSVLGDVANGEALAFAEKACSDETVKAEAETASRQIAMRIFFTERPVAERALRRLAAEAKEERIRSDAKAFMADVDAHADYIIPWLASQPYRVEGKGATELFDIALGPELPDGGGVIWNPVPAPADPAMFWMADLAGVVGGNNCVVYVKTQVFAEREGEVQLEIGSDDGIKLWVNGALVHSNNAVRGFNAGQDKASVTLKKGWNTFFAKISQHSMGCSVAIRVHAAGGPAIQPVRVEAR